MNTKATTLWAGIPDTCCMGNGGSACLCGRTEQVVRLYAAGAGPRPLTTEEREDLITDSLWAGEGTYSREQLAAMTDKQLADAMLHAWSIYARGLG